MNYVDFELHFEFHVLSMDLLAFGESKLVIQARPWVLCFELLKVFQMS